jgi:hypothetical protein
MGYSPCGRGAHKLQRSCVEVFKLKPSAVPGKGSHHVRMSIIASRHQSSVDGLDLAVGDHPRHHHDPSLAQGGRPEDHLHRRVARLLRAADCGGGRRGGRGRGAGGGGAAAADRADRGGGDGGGGDGRGGDGGAAGRAGLGGGGGGLCLGLRRFGLDEQLGGDGGLWGSGGIPIVRWSGGVLPGGGAHAESSSCIAKD